MLPSLGMDFADLPSTPALFKISVLYLVRVTIENMARLVVIDDEIDLCELIRRMFLDQGHEVVYFTDEDEALAWLRQENADLLIVDVQLKRKTGLDILRQVRNLDLSPKVIIITAYPSIRTAKEAVSLGASDYLIKPVDIDELERKVNRILDERAVNQVP